jgi:hypothetical protein
VTGYSPLDAVLGIDPRYGEDGEEPDAGAWTPPEPEWEARAREHRREEMRARLLTSEQVKLIESPTGLIGTWIYPASIASLHGESDTWKSLIAISMACCVSTGRPWFGCEVQQGPVLYVVGEGLDGIGSRVQAWEDASGTTANVMFYPEAVQLLSAETAGDVIWLAQQIGAVLIIFDTQADMTSGVEENATAEMTKLAAILERIYKATGACVLMVHHDNRGGEYRGNSVIGAKPKSRLHTTRKDGTVTLACEKQRDALKPNPIRLEIVPVGPSVIVAEAHPGPSRTSADTSATSARSLTREQKLVCGALRRCDAEVGMTRHEVQHEAGLGEDKAYRVLNALVKKEVAERVDDGQAGVAARWRLVPGEPPQTSAGPPQ